jgi:predicted nucleic acid-binding Zn ribbon protein
MARSSKRRENGGSAPLQGLLEQALNNLDLGAKVREQRALRAWPQAAGRAVGRHTRAEVLRDGVLLVATDSPAWAQELSMRRPDLLAKLETALGPGVVSDIHFRSGFRARPEEEAPPPPRPADTALSARQQQEIAHASARIDDPELRNKAERAFTSLARVSTWRREQGWRRCGRCGQWQRTGKRWCASCLHAGTGHGE